MANEENINQGPAPEAGQPQGEPTPAPMPENESETAETPATAAQSSAAPEQFTTESVPETPSSDAPQQAETPAAPEQPETAETPAAPEQPEKPVKEKKEKKPKKEKREKNAPQPEIAEAPSEPSAAFAAPAASAAPEVPKQHSTVRERRRRRHRSHPRRYWLRRHRRRYLRHLIKRIFLFLLAVLLGVMLTLGLLVGGAFFALGGLTIDFLQKFGIAEGADEYLTDQGEVDLTNTSLLELFRDFAAVGKTMDSHSMQSLMNRYGLRLPDEVMRVLPTDLFEIPLSRLLSSDGGNAVTENLTLGYFLSFLPEGMLAPQVVNTLSPRPLSLLVESDWKNLFDGIQIGYFTGVTYNSEGRAVYEDPDAPTPQELLAELDLGRLMDAMAHNGDFLGVLATDLADKEVGALISGMTAGALIDTMVKDKTIGDVILLNEETGRYELSFTALSNNVKLGQVLNYTEAGGEWYSEYTDDGDDSNDVKVTGMEKYLADVSLSDLMDGTLSLDNTFDGVFFGDLQGNYVRGAAIYGTPAEPGDDPPLTGYEWTEGGEPVKAMAKAIANIKISDVLSGNLNISDAMGDLAFGDLQNYVKHEDGKWYEKQDPPAEDKYVGAVQNALANILLSGVVNDGFDVNDTLAGLFVGDAMGYIPVEEIDPDHPEDPPTVVWYKKYDADHLDDPEKTEKVTGRDAAFVDIAITDLINGELNLDSKLDDMTLADAMNYQKADGVWYTTYVGPDDPGNKKVTGILSVLAEEKLSHISDRVGTVKIGEVLNYTPVEEGMPAETVWYEKYDADHLTDPEKTKRATGVMATLADLTVDDLSDEGKVSDTVGDITLADALGYKYVDGVWYEKYDADHLTDPEKTKKASSVMATLADKQIKNMSDAVNDAHLYDILGYTQVEDVWYTTYIGPGDPGNERASGVLVQLADLKVGELSDNDKVTEKINNIKLYDALGYKYVDGVYYSTYIGPDDPGNVKVTGILSVLADKKLNAIEGSVGAIRIGEVMKYIPVEEGMPAETVWYTVYNGPGDPGNQRPSGMMATLAALTIDDLGNERTVSDKVGEITLADALGYKYVDGVWYEKYDADHLTDPEKTKKASSVMATLADEPINSMSDAVNDAHLYDILGYTQVEDVWYTTYVGPGDPGNERASGVLVQLADLKVGELSDNDKVTAKINNMQLSDVLGYTWVEERGAWYSSYDPLHPETGKITGVLAQLMESRVGALSTTIDDVKLGAAMGYYEHESVWYEDAGHTVPVTGVLKAFAPLTTGELSNGSTITDTVEALSLGDALGYTKEAGVWYDKTHTAAHGIIGALCDTRIDGLGAEVDDMKLGTMLDYEEHGGVWYERYDPDHLDDPVRTKKVEGILATLSGKTISELGTAVSDLQLSDVFGYEEHGGVWYSTYLGPGNPGNVEVSGIVKLIGPDTAINELDDVDLAEKPLLEFYQAGVLIRTEHLPRLKLIFGDPGWETTTFADFMDEFLTT